MQLSRRSQEPFKKKKSSFLCFCARPAIKSHFPTGPTQSWLVPSTRRGGGGVSGEEKRERGFGGQTIRGEEGECRMSEPKGI